MNIRRHKYTVFIGTYTRSESKGIYSLELDTVSGTLSPAKLAAEIKNPSYLVIDPSGKYLYTILEIEEHEGKPGGAVGAYRIGPSAGRLSLMNIRPTGGKHPCHISMDSGSNHLFIANYKEGTAAVLEINPDHSVGSVTALIRHQGSGPDPVRQEQPHTHYTALTPDEFYLCAVDLGIDKIMLYDYIRQTGSLKPASSPFVQIRPGSGPRHMTFHPNRRFAYLVNELSSDIAVFEYNDGAFREIQYISTLPGGYTGANSCAAIHMSSGGDYLYASNRGHNSIAVFAVDPASGMLNPIDHTSTLGDFPRDFSIDPSGRFLLAANQNSNTLVLFRIMPETGRLMQSGSVISVPEPVCVKITEEP